MNIIHSHNALRLDVPQSKENAAQAQAWVASLCDSGWLVLTDFWNWPNWISGVTAAKQLDSEPPARGTKLQVDTGQRCLTCSIDLWDPPRRLQFSIEQGSAEMAYGFRIESLAKEAQVLISLELEQSLSGLSALCAPYFKWRLDKLGKRILANLAARVRPATSRSA